MATDRPIQPFLQGNWRGGINTSLPPNEISDDEAADILNYEVDWDGNLVVRNGVTQHSDQSYSTRLTSAHTAVYEGGQEFIVYTTDNDLFRVNLDGSGTTSIGGALTLPTNTFWQWKNFENLAIGVNRATSGDNPVKVNSAGAAAALGGSPPKAKFIEVWNNRVWVVSATEPNQVRCSALGLPETWATGPNAGDPAAYDVDPGDGDEITGLIAFKKRLFVFKRKRIFVIQAHTAPAEDKNNLEVELFNANIGCVSAHTIQAVLDDVLFLAEGGVASLTSAEIVADFRSALVSRKVSEIGKIKKVSDEFATLVLDDVSQYWLAVPAALSVTGFNVVYVLDYTDLAAGAVRWVRFDGKVWGSAYTSFVGASNKTYIVGGQASGSSFRLYRYQPRDVLGAFSDDGAAYGKFLKTKAYDLGSPLFRKHFWKWGFGFRLINSPVAVSIAYAFDQSAVRNGAYGFNLVGDTGGSLWDVMDWGDDWAGAPEQVDRDVVRDFHKIKPGPPMVVIGQDAQNVQFVVSNGQAGQAFLIKDFILFYSLVSELGVSEV